MEKLISYMSIAYGLNEDFWKIKKGLENDLKPILEMNALHFSVQGNLLQIEIEHADSTTETLILFLRSEKEGI